MLQRDIFIEHTTLKEHENAMFEVTRRCVLLLKISQAILSI